MPDLPGPLPRHRHGRLLPPGREAGGERLKRTPKLEGDRYLRTDLQRFANTQMQVCWNGSVEAPVFRTTGGQEPMEAGMSTFVAPALAAFAPAIADFWYGPRATRERLEKRAHGWQGGVSVMGYLAGKYLERRTLEPSHLSVRDRFAAKPENAAFLREMEYPVPVPAGP